MNKRTITGALELQSQAFSIARLAYKRFSLAFNCSKVLVVFFKAVREVLRRYVSLLEWSIIINSGGVCACAS